MSFNHSTPRYPSHSIKPHTTLLPPFNPPLTSSLNLSPYHPPFIPYHSSTSILPPTILLPPFIPLPATLFFFHLSPYHPSFSILPPTTLLPPFVSTTGYPLLPQFVYLPSVFLCLTHHHHSTSLYFPTRYPLLPFYLHLTPFTLLPLFIPLPPFYFHLSPYQLPTSTSI